MKLRILSGKKVKSYRIVTKNADEPYAIRVIEDCPTYEAPTFKVLVTKAKSIPFLIKRFNAEIDFQLEAKGVETLKDAEGSVVDYQNVKIKGYLSTFESTTPVDRQGDAVLPGAFRDTIPKFMQNPVMLVDHRNSAENIAGRFTEMKEDKAGLYFEAAISNAPGMQDVRFKIMEGSLKTTSMGGLFHYAEGNTKIFKVDLWEGSLVAIPANPDARFSVRALDDSDRKFMRTRAHWQGYKEFLDTLEESET